MLRSRSPRVVRILGGWLLCGGLLAVAPLVAMPKPGEHWVRADTANFTMFGSTGEARTTEIARGLERLRLVLEVLGSPFAPVPDEPCHVYLFRSWEDARSYLPNEPTGKQIPGMVVVRPEGHYIVASSGSRRGIEGLAFHEYLHAVITASYPEAPLWFNEGMAELFGTFWANDHEALIGAAHEDHLHLLRNGGFLPLRQMFAVTTDSEAYTEPQIKTRFHAHAWSLVHYLLFGREGAVRTVRKWISEPTRPITEHLGVSAGALQKELRAYVARQRHPAVRMHMPRERPPIALDVRSMSTEDTWFHLGELQTKRGQRYYGKAEKHFRRVIRKDPSHAPSHAALGALLWRRGRQSEADALMRRSLELDPAGPLSSVEEGFAAYDPEALEDPGADDRSPARSPGRGIPPEGP